ncbi:MAG: aldo/keto reductase [Planctomycetota bacterium]|nr:MAG: aldo/keto reductase [Planctomycetota bacterium]
MITRRAFCGSTLGVGAALALTPELLRAAQKSEGKLIERAIPSSGEKLPVIGLTFGNIAPSTDHAALKEVLKTLVDSGGRVVDTMHDSTGASELVTATLANELAIQSKVFWAVRGSPPGPPQPEAAAAKAQLERSFARLKVPKLDLVQVHVFADPSHLAVMKELKKEGRVRYIGVQVIADNQYEKLESMMRNEPIDFVGVDYAIDNRGVEETILPLAEERKIGVLAYLPFGGNSARDGSNTSRLFPRAGTRPLPEWAADFDAKTWAQFFLKYVISHPAVTVVRTGTSQAKHMLDNIAGGIGRLPDAATRKRMAELVDAWPAAAR